MASSANKTYLQKKRGRKGKNSGKKGAHDKYSEDNLVRKLKTKLFEAILNYLNFSFNNFHILNSKNILICKKRFFLKIKQEIIKNINVNFNLSLFNSKLKDIFSNDISKKIKRFNKNHNRDLVTEIYEEKEETKVISILERTFLECLEQFRGSKEYEELKGLEKYQTFVIRDFKAEGKSQDYIDKFIYIMNTFEKSYKEKKSIKR